MVVEVNEIQITKHLCIDRMSEAIVLTIESKIPKKKKIKFDDRESSVKTKTLFDHRIRDYSSGREIKKSDRKARNSVIAKTCKQDYHDWLKRWIQKIE